MEQNFLITFNSCEGYHTYCWFATEEQLIEFIEDNKNVDGFVANEAMEILSARDIKII